MFGFKTRKKLIAINNKLVELNKQLGEKLTSAYNERNNLRLDNEILHKKVEEMQSQMQKLSPARDKIGRFKKK